MRRNGICRRGEQLDVWVGGVIGRAIDKVAIVKEHVHVSHWITEREIRYEFSGDNAYRMPCQGSYPMWDRTLQALLVETRCSC